MMGIASLNHPTRLRFAALPPLAHVDVDIEIDLADTGCSVRCEPLRASGHCGRAHLTLAIQTPHCGSLPLLSRRTASQHDLFAVLAVPMMCGHSSRVGVIAADHLLPEDALRKKCRWRWHRE